MKISTTFLAAAMVLLCPVMSGAATFTVTNTNNSGAGSLRQAILDAGGLPGADVVVLSGITSPIVLSSEIVISDADGVIIDASAVTGGVTVDGGPGTNRIFSISSGANVTLRNLTLTGGNGTGAANTGEGGAILNLGALTLTSCTVSGNTAATRGGGIQNEAGTLTVNRCTIAANTAVNAGGGISNDQSAGNLTVTQSTFSGNTATNTGGGALHNANNATATLTHCTISGNQSPGGTGGGVRRVSGSVTVTNCIVADNTASSGSNLNGTITQTAANLTSGSVLLAPLGSYGGPTETMPPLAGSPAIDAATSSTITSDQRGLPITGGVPDIGAAERQYTTLVSTTADTGEGSLRSALSYAEALPGPDTITFAPALSGQTITFGSEIVLTDTGGVMIDASALPGGVTLSGNNAARIFAVSTGAILTLRSLTFTGGNGAGTTASGSGGAIYCNGSLSLERCTFTGNTAPTGAGGAFMCQNAGASVIATQCTFVVNTAGGTGGGAVALATSGSVTLTHCTISANTANGPSGAGGGLRRTSGTLTITNCIVADNTATTAGTENVSGTIIQTGANLTSGSPLLSSLGNYGGPTQTMALLPGSPALDAATGSTATSDQRGFPVFVTADVGAYEAQMGAIATTTINEDTGTGAIAISVGAIGTLSAVSSVPGLVSDFTFGGSGGSRTLVITPATNQNGSATITITDSPSGETQTFTLTVNAVNDAPSFTKGADQTVAGNAGLQTVTGWATAFIPGPANESAQTLAGFNVSNDSNALFTVQPAVSPAGVLTYTPAPGAFGSATVSVSVSDNGGTANGGVDTSPVQTFTINVLSMAVTQTSDSGPGSLRQAIADAALIPGPGTITFAPALTGPIVLASEIVIVFGNDVTIDGGNLPGGVTIDGGPGMNRIFTVNDGATVTLRGLTLTGGNGTGASSGGGGAVSNAGSLTLTQCTFYGNSASGAGGAIHNARGVLTADRCTFSANSTVTTGGGAINHTSTATSMTLTHCTIAGNSTIGNEGGGGIRNRGPSLTLTHCIVAGNTVTDGTGPDLNTTVNVALGGANIIRTQAGAGIYTGTGTNSTADPLLAPLGSYGGPTQTMALLPGSLARNAATGSTITSDQRGFAIVGTPDIGAYEAQIGAIADQTVNEDTGSGAVPFTVGTVGTLTAISSNATLVPNENITLSGSGSARTVDVTPAENENGSAIITLTDSLSGEQQTFTLTVMPVNDAPSFERGADQSIPHDAGPQSLPGWATAISAGPVDEAGQTLTFNVTNSDNALFSVQPAVSSDGTLTFTPALNANSSATVTLTLSDNGGIANAGADTSEAQTFTIYVLGPFPFSVSQSGNSGAGSLRQAIANAAIVPGPNTITFDLAAGSSVNLTTDLTITDAPGVTLNTAVSGGAVDVAVNAGTLTFRTGSVWTGGGRILLGDTSGSAAATVEVNGPNGFTLAAPITVRGGSSGVKTLLASNTVKTGTITNTYAGDITLLAPATVERTAPSGFSGQISFTGKLDLGAYLLTVNVNDLVRFNGQVGRFDGTGTAQVVKNGVGGLTLGGSGDNPRLAATVNAGSLSLSKTSSASVHALGSGLPAGTTTLTVADVAQAFVGGDQIADTASVTVDGYLGFNSSETLDALNGIGWVGQPSSSVFLTLGAGNGSGSFSGALHDAGGTLYLTKTGTGTQTLSGSSSMSGAVLVSGGTLNVTGSLAMSSGTIVQSGAALAGTGTVRDVALASGSFFAPGDATLAGSIGTLNITGGTTWDGGGAARFHLSNSSNSSDQLALSGALTKGTGSGFVFDFQDTGAASQIYTLATFASSSFAVGDFTATNLAPGLRGFFTLNSDSLTFTTYASTEVTTTGDSGPGSLRQAIADAALSGPDTITFAPALSGQTIMLSSEIVMDMTNQGNLTLDASTLPGGLTIDGGPGTNRIFFITKTGATFGTVTLMGLTLTGGNGTGATASGNGGAIFNNAGTLTLAQCTLSGNSASYGGAIGNSSSTLTLERCTLSGNSATNNSGAIDNFNSTLMLAHCTLSGNSASYGGAIGNYSSMLTLTNSIVAGNTALSGPDIYRSSGTVTATGVNLLSSLANSTLIAGPTVLVAAPLLAPLGDYGGPTQTLVLLPGSPALNAATGSTATTDQRGFPIVGTADIGAYEAGTATNFNAWIYETLPATATVPQHAATFDFDGDGVTNENEWPARTDPGDAASYFRIIQSAINGTNFSLTFPTVLGRTYQLQSSANLAPPWTDIGTPTAGTGGNMTVPVDVTGQTKHFFRVAVGAP
ncbi:MAG: autotransporter-associated beta strand repeat-containing protein [Verrucomicrobiaceae bacterium]|nr:autotransporter-associated beta strand repeat-containing protein [Verrucomicrobiaceae bacterium]